MSNGDLFHTFCRAMISVFHHTDLEAQLEAQVLVEGKGSAKLYDGKLFN